MKNIIQPYTIEPLNKTILFCCCENFGLVKEYIKDKKVDKVMRKEIMEVGDNQDGLLLTDDETNEVVLIYVKERKKDWYFYEVLLHETNHLVYYLARHYGFTDETEFQATLHESLFRNFRLLIQKK